MKLWVAFVAAALSAHAQGAVRYTAVELKTPEGLNMQAFGLNDAGEIVGGVQGAAYQAYHRSAQGVYRGLGGLGGNRSTATAIADNGVIAGMGRTGATGLSSIPFIDSPDGIRAIALPDRGDFGIVTDVNASGTIAGSFRERLDTRPSREVAFRWTQAGGYEILGSDTGLPIIVRGINSSGVAVGEAADSAFKWNSDGAVTFLEKPADVAVDGLNFSGAADINDQGLIAGGLFWDDSSGQTRKQIAIWGSNGHLLRTASLADGAGPSATSINSRGDVVGSAYLFEGFPDGTVVENEYAIFWSAGGELIDMNTLFDLSGTKLIGSFGINDRGQIIAWGLRDGVRVDVLLNPIANAVPEPSSWALLIAGFGLAGLGVRRSKAIGNMIRSAV